MESLSADFAILVSYYYSERFVDVTAGCLLKSGVLIGDSRDSLERGRFFPLGPHVHIRGGIPQWYKKNAFYKPYAVSNQNGFYCCHLSAVGGFRVQ